MATQPIDLSGGFVPKSAALPATTPAPAGPSPTTSAQPIDLSGGLVQKPLQQPVQSSDERQPKLPLAPGTTTNNYQAVPEEATAEGNTQAIVRREAEHPILASVGHVATGAVKSGLQTLHTGAALGSRAIPRVQDVPFGQPKELETHGLEEGLGAGLENIVEFMAGDAALKGLSLATRLGIAQKVVSLAEKSPLLAKALQYGMKAVHGATLGGAVGGVHGGKEGAEAGAVVGGIAEPAGSAVMEGAGKLKSLLFPSEETAHQALRDAVKGAVGGGANADANAVNEIASRTDKQTLLSNIENQLKQAKIKLDSEIPQLNGELEHALANSPAISDKTASTVTETFDKLIGDVTAGVGTNKQASIDAIEEVWQEVSEKLTDEPMTAEQVNSVKRLVGDQIKKFAPPENLSTVDSQKKEAYRQAYFSLRDIVSEIAPETKDLNTRISHAISAQDLLEKKFPHLATSEQAQASYEAAKSEAAKGIAKKTAKAVGTGVAIGAGIKGARHLIGE